ncbi:MAG: MarR family transcriptional regulator [Chloroflexota bacterium]
MTEMSGMDITRRLYCFILHYFAAHRISPTQREMADGCFVSAGTITRHLDRLEMFGLIEREPGLPRSVRLTDRDDEEMHCTEFDFD